LLTVGELGARNGSEALWLQWLDVELDGGFVRIVTGRGGHRTKTGRSRRLPMSPRLQSAMRAHFARYRFAAYDGRSTPWVFHHDYSQRTYTAGERVKSFHTAFRSAVKRAKLPPNLWVYDLRHRRITNWLGEGQSPVHVRDAGRPR
jgi:integrase